ncbi:unnamed protein product [Discosporangium mesarthrocarpum]
MGRRYSQMGRIVKVMVKMVQKFGHVATNGIRVICCLVDGKIRPQCRPLDDVAQAATYSGYKRNHEINFQGVVLPKGIMADFWGPVVGRRHDRYLCS